MQLHEPTVSGIAGTESRGVAGRPSAVVNSASGETDTPGGPTAGAGAPDPSGTPLAGAETAAATGPTEASDPRPSIDIAVIQFAPYTDKDANLAMLRDEVRTATERGARVVIAPEYSMFATTRLDRRVVAAAEPITGPWVDRLRALAADFGVHVVAGVAEKPSDGDSERIWNTLVAAGPGGEYAAVYRKAHLYDAFGFRESDVVVPGEIAEPATFTVDGVVFGLQTCFDLRFPESLRRVAAAGADVIALPAQWIPGPGKLDHWTTLLRARAIENTVYVAAADQAGPRGAGASMIIDPAGTVLSELGDSPALATARIDLEHLARVRAGNPSLSLRRFTVEPRSRT